MALGVNALTTWDRAKTALGFSSDQQAAVEFLIDAVSATANRISGRRLKARDYADIRIDGLGRDTIVLPEFPIISLSGIYVDSLRVFSAESMIDITEYQVLSDSGIVRLYSRKFPIGIGNIKVVGNIGYVDVPEDLELAVLEGVGCNRRRLESGTTGMRQVSADGSVTSQYELGLPLSVREVFESYRDIRI